VVSADDTAAATNAVVTLRAAAQPGAAAVSVQSSSSSAPGAGAGSGSTESTKTNRAPGDGSQQVMTVSVVSIYM